MSRRRTILLTNDDGIDSLFMHVIARELARDFDLTIVAPASEQSWIGRAMSRRKTLEVIRVEKFPWPAWSVSGTPSDCVNIALGNLLPTLPDAVVSGFNIGYNTTVPLIYSSGTVAGASEGAFWGCPSFALSQAVPDTIFEEVTHSCGESPQEMKEILAANASHAATFVRNLIQKEQSTDAIVHNLNYPASIKLDRIVEHTVPAKLSQLALYKHHADNRYSFAFQHGIQLDDFSRTDRDALNDGNISHSILNFSSIGRDQ